MDVDPGVVPAIQRFIDEVIGALEVVADKTTLVDAAQVHSDVVLEAFNLTGALVSADGLQTDAELESFAEAFAPQYGGHLAGGPSEIRRSGMITGRQSWLADSSDMFTLLADLDAKQGSRLTWTYYERSIELAIAVASIDDPVTEVELEHIEAFRDQMLATIDRAGVARPGTRAQPGGQQVPTAATDAEPVPAVEDQPPARPLDELLAELDELIGLDAVKNEIKLVTDLIRVQNLRTERGLPVPETSRHLVFAGNPGTGKTTVGRLVAEIYRTLGVVEMGHLVETDRGGLVAAFVGQTAPKVTLVFDQADEGVLLIDEAYSLIRGKESDFGREAIDAIVKLMEDRRDRVVVIAAGYPDEMSGFLDANPGLRSRFPKTIVFEDYDATQLLAIFDLIADKQHYTLTDAAREKVGLWLGGQPRGKGFGNGRLVRNLFEDAVGRHATRVVDVDRPTDVQLVTLTHDDIAEPGDGPRHHGPSR
jgi:hypothetical protein